MSVYVDDMRAPFGRMVMCHCWADTREELFDMMTRIGIQHRWFQRPEPHELPGMPASWEHFDISLSKRALAIKFGAIETDRYGPSMHEAMRKFHDPRSTYDQQFRALKMICTIAHVRSLRDVS